MNLADRVSYDGGRVVYATDHEPYAKTLDQVAGRGEEGRAYGERLDRELVDFATGVDLYIADAQDTDEEYPARVGWGHAALSEGQSLTL